MAHESHNTIIATIDGPFGVDRLAHGRGFKLILSKVNACMHDVDSLNEI